MFGIYCNSVSDIVLRDFSHDKIYNETQKGGAVLSDSKASLLKWRSSGFQIQFNDT